MSIKFTFSNLSLILIIGIISTVTITENLQISDGFLSKSTKGWVYELNPGESQVLTWTLTNTEEKAIDIEFRAEGNGSELFVFEKIVSLESKEKKSFEFIVTVPKDHLTNIEYRPILFALEKAKQESTSGSAVLINYQMSAKPVIKIGDNPVFTPEVKPVIQVEEEVKPAKVFSDEPIIEITPTETLEEKLARIQAANEMNVVDEPVNEQALPVEVEVFEQVFTPEPVAAPTPEPTAKASCGIIDLILSWFGIGNC